MRINYRLGWLAVGGRGGRRAGSRVPLDGGRDTKQKGEDEAVRVFVRQTRHAHWLNRTEIQSSAADNQPAATHVAPARSQDS